MKMAIWYGAVLASLIGPIAHAENGPPWSNHRAPFDFLFGNELDTHQQTQRLRDGSLSGFFYIHYTGVLTADGLPVATHVDCNSVADCVVGWRFDGLPSAAKLVLQPMEDHPIFWIGRADIPQPGAYSHFHWTGMAMPAPYVNTSGFMLQLTAADRFCFIHHGAEAASGAVSCRDNGGIKVERGTDLATHLNIIPNDPNAM
jgi:hypothetical protein